MAVLEFEHAYFDVEVSHIKCYSTRNLPSQPEQSSIEINMTAVKRGL